MNYIRHLSGFFIRLAEDQRITPYHISLYLALFQEWNSQRFVDWFVVSRSEMMQQSRIGSANTYARCIKELDQWGYINYAAAANIHVGSRVSCIRFDTGNDTASDTGINNDTASDTGADTASDTGTSSGTKSDTGTDTASDTGTNNDTATDTGADTASDTGTSSGIKSDTAADTASDTGTSGSIKSDTARDTASGFEASAGITAGIKSDTLFINKINKNNPLKKRGEIFDSSEEKNKNENNPQKTNFENSGEEKNQIPDFYEIENFFRKNDYPNIESQNFFTHYHSIGWKLSGKNKILDWQAAAKKWMINAKKIENNERETNQIRTGKLSVTINKDYAEPL